MTDTVSLSHDPQPIQTIPLLRDHSRSQCSGFTLGSLNSRRRDVNCHSDLRWVLLYALAAPEAPPQRGSARPERRKNHGTRTRKPLRWWILLGYVFGTDARFLIKDIMACLGSTCAANPGPGPGPPRHLVDLLGHAVEPNVSATVWPMDRDPMVPAPSRSCRPDRASRLGGSASLQVRLKQWRNG